MIDSSLSFRNDSEVKDGENRSSFSIPLEFGDGHSANRPPIEAPPTIPEERVRRPFSFDRSSPLVYN